MLYLNCNEKRQHGTAAFPFAFYHIDCNHARYEMPFHWHKEYEILRILDGFFCLTTDDTETVLRSGDCAFIAGGAIHGGIPSDCIYECIVFDMDALFLHADSCLKYLRRIKQQEVLLPSPVTERMPLLQNAIHLLFSFMTGQSPGYELSVVGCLFEIFGLIFREHYFTENSPEHVSSLRHASRLKCVFEYIENNYSSSITLKQLSQLSGMSSKYFCRYFQTIAHKTPIDYLNFYRIECSCHLLDTTDLPVTAIAYECGFNDCSYFIRLFKRYKHLTPKQYQLQLRQPQK